MKACIMGTEQEAQDAAHRINATGGLSLLADMPRLRALLPIRTMIAATNKSSQSSHVHRHG